MNRRAKAALLLEHFGLALRHSALLRRAHWLWALLRPAYGAALRQLARSGLVRVMNGTDEILVLPAFRHVIDRYEPDAWRVIMDSVRPGDFVADVGANIGLYTIALARRVGDSGKVFAYEPDPATVRTLRAHVELNEVAAVTTVRQVAAGASPGPIPFVADGSVEAHIADQRDTATIDVACVRLDEDLASHSVDLLKIDTEGFELQTLEGASGLLDRMDGPRMIFVEVHPQYWSRNATTAEAILALLRDSGYAVEDLKGEEATTLKAWTHIVCRKKGQGWSRGSTIAGGSVLGA